MAHSPSCAVVDDGVLVATPADLTREWLADVVKAPVTGFSTARIAPGPVSDTYRVSLEYDDTQGQPQGEGEPPKSVVLKVAAEDETNRNSGNLLELYERESRFYSEVAPNISLDAAPLAHCYHSSHDTDNGTVCLVLDDAAPADCGNELQGTTLERAKLALHELGRLHAATAGDEELADKPWLNRGFEMDQARFQMLYGEFAKRYGERVKPQHLAVVKRLAESFDLWRIMEEEEEGSLLGLMHGDYRLDNMLFGKAGSKRPLTVVDWQTVQWGHVLNDVSYFIAAALTIEDRRAWEGELLQAYYRGLGPNPPLSMEVLTHGVREHTFYGIIMATVAPIFVKRTEAGDDMFLTLFARHCEHALDLDALTLLPQPPAPRQPRPTEEAQGRKRESVSVWSMIKTKDGRHGLWSRWRRNKQRAVA